jgi:hypothetical protein
MSFFSLSLCSSLNIRDHVSHPYRTTGKIIVVYILILTALIDVINYLLLILIRVDSIIVLYHLSERGVLFKQAFTISLTLANSGAYTSNG